MNDKLFRTSIVGGYNKEDVLSYISRLETELVRIQKKISGREDDWEPPKKKKPKDDWEAPKKKITKNMDENVVDEDVIVLRDTQEETVEKEVHIPEKEQEINQEIRYENSREASSYEEQSRELAEVRLELEKVRNELLETKTELGISNQKYEQSEQKKESLLELIQRLIENYNGLQVSQCYLVEQMKNIEHMGRQIEMLQDNMEHFLKVDVNMSDSF